MSQRRRVGRGRLRRAQSSSRAGRRAARFGQLGARDRMPGDPLCRRCTQSDRSAAGERLRGEPAARRPTKAAARRLRSPSGGSACASSGLCSRPAAGGKTGECVALRSCRCGGPDDRSPSKAIVPIEAVLSAQLKPDGSRNCLLSRRSRASTDAAVRRCRHASPADPTSQSSISNCRFASRSGRLVVASSGAAATRPFRA